MVHRRHQSRDFLVRYRRSHTGETAVLRVEAALAEKRRTSLIGRFRAHVIEA
jgi:hypothetical protein